MSRCHNRIWFSLYTATITHLVKYRFGAHYRGAWCKLTTKSNKHDLRD